MNLSPSIINHMISAVKRIMKEGYLNAERALAFSGVAGVKPHALKSRQHPQDRTL